MTESSSHAGGEATELAADIRDYLIRYTDDFYERTIVKASGSWIEDDAGKRILDFTSGQICSTIGHNHTDILAAMRRSMDGALHLFSGMLPPAVIELAKQLAAIAPPPLRKSLFVNTGGESNEAALKMAKMATGGFEVIALGGSWHGVTGTAAGATFASDRRGYGPPMPGNFAIPEPHAYRCPIEHCKNACDKTCLRVGMKMFDAQSAGAPAAIVAEPVISAGGVIVPPEGYFAALKQEAEQRGMLLIFDEAQTAFGRLGAWFAAGKIGVTPDLLTCSKTLGGGVPLAAVIASAEVEERAHARGFKNYTSHVADPLPAEVGLAVLMMIARDGLLEHATEMGTYLRSRLEELQTRHQEIGDVRGDGLLLGVELVRDRETREPHPALARRSTGICLERGLSMNIRIRAERGSVWRIAPPLTVTREEIDLAVSILDESIGQARDELAREGDR